MIPEWQIGLTVLCAVSGTLFYGAAIYTGLFKKNYAQGAFYMAWAAYQWLVVYNQ